MLQAGTSRYSRRHEMRTRRPIRNNVLHYLLCVLAFGLLLPASAFAAIAPETIRDLALGEGDARESAIASIVASGDPSAQSLLQAMQGGEVKTVGDDRVYLIKGDEAVDLLAGKTVKPVPDNLEDVVVNNRLRRELGMAIAALKLASGDRTARLAAAKELQGGADESTLPAISAALVKESDPEIKGVLALTQASVQLSSSDKAIRLAAVRELAQSDSASVKTLLLGLLERKGGEYVERDAELRAEAERSLRAVEQRLSTGEMVARVFSGISLGTILLLAALGLAITYGLMGVINMAHGELIMIGAYATYVVQNLFRQHFPGAFDAYLICAIPVAFAVSGIVGMVLERTVIRWLYGRPLETLLATWGLSLVLIQSVRTIFGAQNVQVENPSWMSGGIEAITGVVLPWSRIAIIIFAAFVLTMMWLLLTRTRLGLFVR